MKLNLNFLGEGVREGVQNKKPSVGGVWIFSGTTHKLAINLGNHTLRMQLDRFFYLNH